MKLEYFLLFSLLFVQSLALPARTERDQPSETLQPEDAYISKIDSEKEEQGNYYFVYFS